MDENINLAFDASYDNVDIDESLLDLPEACGDEDARVRNDSGEESEQLGPEKKCTSQTGVNVSATEMNDGQSKDSHEEPSLKGSNVFSFCNESYKLA